MLAPRAAVLRDGQRVTVDGANLVPGDVVLLESGDKVPADLQVLEAHGLAAQEAIPIRSSCRSARVGSAASLAA
jgi:magnesium-transporting ATPase (P-type)